mmetsp:Transcript_46935/g.102037  ORF Transcript_46935/g.102037 Transcript_46935/m.102037 type:complete len:215 (+) Transcript_46935:1005-1649(+)
MRGANSFGSNCPARFSSRMSNPCMSFSTKEGDANVRCIHSGNCWACCTSASNLLLSEWASQAGCVGVSTNSACCSKKVITITNLANSMYSSRVTPRFLAPYTSANRLHCSAVTGSPSLSSVITTLSWAGSSTPEQLLSSSSKDRAHRSSNSARPNNDRIQDGRCATRSSRSRASSVSIAIMSSTRRFLSRADSRKQPYRSSRSLAASRCAATAT